MISRRRMCLCILTGPLAILTTNASVGAAQGRFTNSVVTEWLPDGRYMQLTQPVEFIGPDEKRWPVPAGTKVDGASIPQFFWSLIGGPFEGQYRDASVVHDFYCQTRIRPCRAVHRVFYEGMLARGVADVRAWLMFKAVDTFGPQWTDPKVDPACEVSDKNYDFERCARNAAPPPVHYTPLTRNESNTFLNEMKGQADEQDLRKLRSAGSSLAR
jgi:hypothetical protein